MALWHNCSIVLMNSWARGWIFGKWDFSDPLWDSSCSSRWVHECDYGVTKRTKCCVFFFFCVSFGLTLRGCCGISVVLVKGPWTKYTHTHTHTQEPTWTSHKSQWHPLSPPLALCLTHFTATLALDLGVMDLPPPHQPAPIGCGWPAAQPTCSTALSLMWLAEDDGSPPVTSTSSSNQQPAMEIDCSNLLSLLLWY